MDEGGLAGGAIEPELQVLLVIEQGAAYAFQAVWFAPGYTLQAVWSGRRWPLLVCAVPGAMGASFAPILFILILFAQLLGG